ncbi:MAG: dTDP-glucose 4,6-dehydratase [Mariprofundaceae bacterium]
MNRYKPEHVLVTGGAGFIGCNFVRHLLESDAKVFVTNVDKLSYAGSPDNLRDLPGEERYRFIQGDICDRVLIERILKEFRIDTIVHFAAESHVDRSISGPEIFVQSNVVGTFTLLDAARSYWLDLDENGCRFHHISTDEVYGSLGSDDPAFTEITSYAPNSPYSASKAASDHLVRAYFHTYGLPVTTTNCSNNYGPFQHQEKFIPTVIRSCLEKKPIPVYGDGSNIRDWLYVADHCRGIDAVIRRGRVGEVYNIGGRNEWSNIDIVQLICNLMDEMYPSAGKSYKSLISFVTDRPGHDWRYAIDCRKIDEELGWRPDETFGSGIMRTIRWYLDRL